VLSGKIMQIRAGFNIAYDCPRPTPMLLMLSVHPSRTADLVTPHKLLYEPYVEARDYRDTFGNIVTRIVAPDRGASPSPPTSSSAIPARPDIVEPDAEQLPLRRCPTT
jgi:hypothetical protein